MENLLGGQKPQAYNRSKIPLWRAIKVYKDLPSSRFPIPHKLLDKHFHTSPPRLHLQEHAWSPSQAWSRPSSQSSIKKKMGFHPSLNEWEMNVQRPQPIFLFRKSIRKIFLKTWMRFSWKANNLQRGRDWRAHSPAVALYFPYMREFFFLKGKWNT